MYIKKSVLASLVILSIGLSGCASYPHQESTGQYVDNSVITTKVKAKLAGDSAVKSSAISVESYKNTVQLSGFVDNERQKQRAIADAQSVPGVAKIIDSLVVKNH